MDLLFLRLRKQLERLQIFDERRWNVITRQSDVTSDSCTLFQSIRTVELLLSAHIYNI